MKTRAHTAAHSVHHGPLSLSMCHVIYGQSDRNISAFNSSCSSHHTLNEHCNSECFNGGGIPPFSPSLRISIHLGKNYRRGSETEGPSPARRKCREIIHLLLSLCLFCPSFFSSSSRWAPVFSRDLLRAKSSGGPCYGVRV